MTAGDSLRIGITCYPRWEGVASWRTALGEHLAGRGHEVHFICYERPFRLPHDARGSSSIRWRSTTTSCSDFPTTLALSVRMAEVSRDHRLDVLHVHYAVPPHATAAILARSMLPTDLQPAGDDAARHGYDAAGLRSGLCSRDQAPLTCSDAVTAVSEALKHEGRPSGRSTTTGRSTSSTISRAAASARSREDVRRELGLGASVVVHSSNLRPGSASTPARDGCSRARGAAFKLSCWRGIVCAVRR